MGSAAREWQLLNAAEAAGFDLMITSDQSIEYQQNLSSRRMALIVLGSNIWPIVREHADAIKAEANAAMPGSLLFIEMPVPRKPRNRSEC